MSERTSTATVRGLTATAYRIPTDGPEADGTFAWDSTTLIVVHVDAGGHRGLGYTYADSSITSLITGPLLRTILDRDVFDICGCQKSMQRAVRNLGRSGLAACAISAIDTALWDLKSKLLKVALADLLGCCRCNIPIYGSGGFTNYSDPALRRQLSDWVEQKGCRAVKMKIGSEPERDPARVRVARTAIGDRELFVDANGAFSAKQALRFAQLSSESQIRWFEEPVTSDDERGLHEVRMGVPTGTDIAAGEYIYTLDDARRLLEADSVDVLQADVTRCGGITGFMNVSALCESHHIDLSGHCAPSLHLHAACAAQRLRHLEWFHDHVRIEQMLFEGAPTACDGVIRPDMSRPGHGLELKAQDAERYRIK
jgi:L-alanine-DL-glutamate epimerase-like enolase superfamily enzyme